MSRWLSSAIMLLGIALAAGIAVAGDGTTVDIGGLVDAAVELLTAVLLAVGTWAVAWLGRRWKLDSDSAVREYLDEALHRSIAWAVGELRTRGQPISIDLRSEIVAKAADYLLERVPDALKHFGLHPASLRKLIEARLPELPPPAPS